MTDANASPGLKRVTIFTDGAAVPNPGAGGYGIVLRFGAHHKELSGGFQRTTNNRMELMAVIVGLEALKERCQVTLHSDSQYIVDAVTSGAAFRWKGNGWKFKPLGAKRVKNPDLWERLLAAYEKHEVQIVLVKGHAGIADNERCDELAMAACKMSDLPADPGYIEEVSEELRQLDGPKCPHREKAERSRPRDSLAGIAAPPSSSGGAAAKRSRRARRIATRGICSARAARPCTSWKKPSNRLAGMSQAEDCFEQTSETVEANGGRFRLNAPLCGGIAGVPCCADSAYADKLSMISVGRRS